MKRSALRRRQKAVAPDEAIRAAMEVAILERQVAWRAELEASAPDWTRLLSLHLQLGELERLDAALGELFL